MGAVLPDRQVVRVLVSHQGELGSIPGGVLPYFHMWESCRTMFSQGSAVPPALEFRPLLERIHDVQKLCTCTRGGLRMSSHLPAEVTIKDIDTTVAIGFFLQRFFSDFHNVGGAVEKETRYSREDGRYFQSNHDHFCFPEFAAVNFGRGKNHARERDLATLKNYGRAEIRCTEGCRFPSKKYLADAVRNFPRQGTPGHVRDTDCVGGNFDVINSSSPNPCEKISALARTYGVTFCFEVEKGESNGVGSSPLSHHGGAAFGQLPGGVGPDIRLKKKERVSLVTCGFSRASTVSPGLVQSLAG
ncbi:hypothetical protein PR048_006752 [Dryococelus australis]|uniref:Uncharacterized protein n=1 Tax=Dryococelus australis TaxID=614101 RepID=A0ABQ9ICG3_9NEOP|nr:hypothetical protein PR048_006752 [Dryococelus australis]